MCIVNEHTFMLTGIFQKYVRKIKVEIIPDRKCAVVVVVSHYSQSQVCSHAITG